MTGNSGAGVPGAEAAHGPSGRAYLDHASTSPLRPAAARAMWDWISAADPGRVHTEGRMARAALEDARDRVAGLFGTRSRQVVFTSGATEAINSAAYGVLAGIRPGAVALGAVEHSAVTESSERWAASVIPLGVDRAGRLDPSEVAAVLDRHPVALVQCQVGNHEVGTVQPVAEIAELCHRHGALLHVDAAAGAGHLPIAFDDLGADLVSVSAHKLGGPKGAGALLVRRNLRITPFIVGGSQERARRAGLENLPAAVGFGAAASELSRPGVLAGEADAARAWTDRLRAAAGSIPDVEIYGPDRPELRLPHLVCLGVGGVEAEPVLIGLDQAGVAAHSGSSCSSESLEPSPVLQAMGVDGERSLRLSVGWCTTGEDIDRCVRVLPGVVARLRELWSGHA